MRKHIHYASANQSVAMLIDQHAGIARQSCRVTGNINDTLRQRFQQFFHHHGGTQWAMWRDLALSGWIIVNQSRFMSKR